MLAGSLKVVNYEGQGRGRRLVTAAELADADVVLTTYAVLAHDIYQQPDVDNIREHNLRRAKRYEAKILHRVLRKHFSSHSLVSPIM